MEEAIRDPRMVLSVVIPRTAGAASATRTTEEAEDWHRIARAVSAVEATVEEAIMEKATLEQATMEEAIVAAVEGKMEEATIGGPRMVLSRTAGATSATRAMEETEDGHRTAGAVSAAEATVKEATIEQATTLVEEATMLDPSMVLLVVALRTAVQGRVATRTM